MCRVQRKAPVRLTSSARCHSCALVVSKRPRETMPAQLTSRSTVSAPASAIAAMARLTDDSEATSTSAPVSRSPASEKARAMASRAALL
ncbi:hypothetical protein AD428_19365 [Achromobacter sp. DMS1]|nr:hypothetical protein AD428_19365 [Achromobacter sp. DMS1]